MRLIMINKEIIEKFLNEDVSIGIKHRFDENKVFILQGKIIEIDDDSLFLRTNKDDIVLSYSQVLQISKSISNGDGEDEQEE